MSLPNAAGAYEVRMFSNNGYTRLARSDLIRSLNVSPLTASAGSEVNVQWQGIESPSATDWMGLYRPGDSDSAPIAWQYVGCAQVPLDARALGSCNVLLPAGLAAGSYEFRLFAADGYTRLAASPALQIH
jgi:hypothetical protein